MGQGFPGAIKGGSEGMNDTFASSGVKVRSGPFIPNDFLGGDKSPYGDDQNPYVPQYNKPDPFAKRNVCGEDTPIQGAKDGKYNLNWIDDQNEHRALISADEYIGKKQSPIFGMDFETFKEVVDDQEYQSLKDQFGVKNKYMRQFPIRTASKKSVNRQCAICCNHYKEGCRVFFLPCSHHFHVECILPWFSKNHKCPYCKYDLNEGDNYNEGIIESD